MVLLLGLHAMVVACDRVLYLLASRRYIILLLDLYGMVSH